MLSIQQKINMARAGIFYKPVAVARNQALKEAWYYIGDDLTGKPLKATVSPLRALNTGILDLGAQVVSSVQKTLQELVDEDILCAVPHDFTPDQSVWLSYITLTAPQGNIEALPAANEPDGDAVFKYDLLIPGADGRVISAGEFIVTAGVTSA